MRTLLFYAYIISSPFLAGGLSRDLKNDFMMYDPDSVLAWVFMALIALPIIIVMLWKMGEAIMNGFNEAMHQYHVGNARVARIPHSSTEDSASTEKKGIPSRRKRLSGQQIKQRVTRA